MHDKQIYMIYHIPQRELLQISAIYHIPCLDYVNHNRFQCLHRNTSTVSRGNQAFPAYQQGDPSKGMYNNKCSHVIIDSQSDEALNSNLVGGTTTTGRMCNVIVHRGNKRRWSDTVRIFCCSTRSTSSSSKCSNCSKLCANRAIEYTHKPMLIASDGFYSLHHCQATKSSAVIHIARQTHNIHTRCVYA